MIKENKMDIAMMQEPSEAEVEQLKGMAEMEADKLDAEETQMMSIEGDFSKRALNRVVDALNRVNKLFDAPVYPSFDSDLEVLPPEFGRNLMMVNSALEDAGITDKMFDLMSAKDDKDLKAIAGKLAAAAGDKVFKSFLATPLGMGDKQSEFGIPVSESSGGDTQRAQSKPAVKPKEETEELFMARMTT